jgi:hypothetical protein
MTFVTSTWHEFRGQRLSIREISRLTGLSAWTLRKRRQRGIPLDEPIYTPKSKQKRPQLTGDLQRDVESIVRWMHRRAARVKRL